MGLRAIGWGTMLAKDVVPQAMGWCGFAGAEILFYTPLPFTFRRIFKEKSVAGFDHTPFVVSVATNVCWVAYGAVTPGRFQPLLTNAVGGFIEVFYVGVFLKFAVGVHRIALVRDLVMTVVILVLILGYSLLLHLPFPNISGESHTSSLLGVASAVVNTCMFASPLKICRRVIQTKSVEFLPMSLCVGGFLCGAFWTIYAILVGDISIFIPNFVGVCTGITQFAVYLAYRGYNSERTKTQLYAPAADDADKEDDEGPVVLVANGDWEERKEDITTSTKKQKKHNVHAASRHQLSEPLLT
mmetsp:Transcript_20951/g.67488  ORF Transcript_20951/g.67488 Transcript_20951/m.67488 type:complete len:299 (-) Transcript_20951:251-1147(-)|eukprot:CAMPEP_0118916494 /NCGR_PEP_ID=MMETSP1166-20130328/16485_1 /TAXON_ID=1104430 /ORGANISM="Chrysoreinhardia sp, Strain CCMP3193" /LENGTH=298 /DNA_ID=CAMNT_0006856369 /DNA_START=64 /DNA_END=960 /DNA_ORIENTATION=-